MWFLDVSEEDKSSENLNYRPEGQDVRDSVLS